MARRPKPTGTAEVRHRFAEHRYLAEGDDTGYDHEVQRFNAWLEQVKADAVREAQREKK